MSFRYYEKGRAICLFFSYQVYLSRYDAWIFRNDQYNTDDLESRMKSIGPTIRQAK